MEMVCSRDPAMVSEMASDNMSRWLADLIPGEVEGDGSSSASFFLSFEVCMVSPEPSMARPRVKYNLRVGHSSRGWPL